MLHSVKASYLMRFKMNEYLMLTDFRLDLIYGGSDATHTLMNATN